ncbi:hypothetical protein D7Y15_23405 [Corallococcus sp. AB030]|uniref:hypothetical protein n=1 Tax=Corallococcus sp. AB030 TaxID=2316716 RepID=UPI000ECE2971|nr:hypothetical protein [Corallococcus sp. AB030]RKI09725.1 hypothetical protein D7Y15_23405 [Corallococcus sp. AB030]
MPPRYCPACRTHRPADVRHWCSGLEELRQRAERLRICPHTYASRIPGKNDWYCSDCDYLGPRPKETSPLG